MSIESVPSGAVRAALEFPLLIRIEEKVRPKAFELVQPTAQIHNRYLCSTVKV